MSNFPSKRSIITENKALREQNAKLGMITQQAWSALADINHVSALMLNKLRIAIAPGALESRKVFKAIHTQTRPFAVFFKKILTDAGVTVQESIVTPESEAASKGGEIVMPGPVEPQKEKEDGVSEGKGN